jgi:hypothetical protein
MPILSEKSGYFRLIRRIRSLFLGHSDSLLAPDYGAHWLADGYWSKTHVEFRRRPFDV